MGAPSRRGEAASLLDTLSRYRPVRFLCEPATLDGGDVLRIGRSVFVGLSRRTNMAGAAQLAEILRSYRYEVQPIRVSGCLHLKSACSYIGDNTILVNRSWIESERLSGFELLDVPEEEPAAANAALAQGQRHYPGVISQYSHLAGAARFRYPHRRRLRIAKSRSRHDLL